MNKIKVKPAEGMLLRMPRSMGGALMDPAGALVPENSYWLRRIKEGSAVLVSSKAAPKPEPKPEPKKTTAKKPEEI